MVEEEGAQRYPCGNADESRTHTVGECELLYKEERDVPEEMRKNRYMWHGKVWYTLFVSRKRWLS